MKKGIVIFLVCFVPFQSYAQPASMIVKVDSIRMLIHQKGLPDSSRINACYKMASIKGHAGDLDSALYYVYLGRTASEKAHYQYGLLDSYQMEGFLMMIKRKYNDALKSKLKALELAQEMNSQMEIMSAYLSLGAIYINLNMQDKAIMYLSKALEGSRRLKLTELEYKIMSNLAQTYQTSGDYKKASALNSEIINLMERSGISDPMAYGAAIHNLANAQEHMGDNVSAVKNYLKAYKYNKGVNDINNFLQINLASLGSILLKDSLNKLGKEIGDYRPSMDISMTYLKELENLAISNKDTGSLVTYYLVASQVLLARGDKVAALQTARKGWPSCKKFSDSETYEEYLGTMGKICFSAGKFKESAVFYKDQKAYSDSLKKVETAGKVALLSNSYDVEQRDEQLKVKEQQLKDNRFITYLFIAISALILILALIVFYFLRQKQKAAKLLEQQNHEIEKARKRAEQSEKFKEQFLASMSHEIRTPLNAVIGMTSLLLDDKQPPKTENYLQNIKQAGEHLTGIINDILDLSKIEAGKLELHEAPFSLHKLLEEMQNLFGIRAKEKDLQLVITEAERVPDWVSGDSSRIRQVLLNLTGNAIKFTDRGSVRIKIAPDGMEGTKPFFQFSVEDTGSGIPLADQARIFEEFVQAGQGVDQKVVGTGLGLSISKKLVERMGGTIRVESEPGKGSVFSFVIPLAISSESAWQEIQSEKEKSMAAMKGNFRILVVEDNLSNQLVTEGILEKILPESTVVMADNGYKALELLEKDRFDLVLMDIRIPGIDGYETTRRLRKLTNDNATVPVVALTASVIRSDIQQCLEAGMNGYIPKPVSREVMAKTIREQLKISGTEVFVKTGSPGTSFLDDLAVKPSWAPGLFEICNGKKSRFLNYLQLFIKETGKELDKWGEWTEKREHELLSLSLHKMISHLRIFSGEGTRNLATGLEERLRHRWEPADKATLDELRTRIIQAQQEAKQLIDDLNV
jgi:signal transduction histidine kinase/DNA-binding response OmpR family regulator